jgi:hypothetical protein
MLFLTFRIPLEILSNITKEEIISEEFIEQGGYKKTGGPFRVRIGRMREIEDLAKCEKLKKKKKGL